MCSVLSGNKNSFTVSSSINHSHINYNNVNNSSSSCKKSDLKMSNDNFKILQEQIIFFLEYAQYENAIKLAGIAHADGYSEDSLLLLGSCYAKAKQFSQAYHVLREGKSAESKYFFALTCVELHKYQEGEQNLNHIINHQCKHLNARKLSLCYELRGKIKRQEGRIEEAISDFETCLSYSKFQLSAALQLCELGKKSMNNIFGSTGTVGSSHQSETPANVTPQSTSKFTKLLDSTPSHTRNEGYQVRKPNKKTKTSFSNKRVKMVTENNKGNRKYLLESKISDVHYIRGNRLFENEKETKEGSAQFSVDDEDSPLATPISPSSNNNMPPGRSINVTPNTVSNVSSSRPLKTVIPTNVPLIDTTGIEKKSYQEPDSARNTSNPTDDENILIPIVKLFNILTQGYMNLCQFQCKRAISLFQSLPQSQYNTAWVLCQIARAYMELGQYEKSEEFYKKARRVCPYQLQGMELFSTVLWQLRKEKELSALAQDLVSLNKLAPESWCAVGNCFSVQKEHETAQRFFERAIQVGPHSPYSYTLLGHEYVYNEDFGKACVCFQSAIRIDSRHYNAWYGLGMIYYRQENYTDSEFHFKKALEINEESSVLHCYLGMVYQAQQRAYTAENSAAKAQERAFQAESSLDQALKLDPNNALAMYKKAEVMFERGYNQIALEVLNELSEKAPKESSVYVLRGKIYKRLGKPDKAMMYFTWARDLDPKGANRVKDIIDKHMEDEDDDSRQEIVQDG